MKGNGRFSQAITRFMQGRYGVDPFSRFLSYASLALFALALVLHFAGGDRVSGLLWYAAFALLLWGYIRMFSRNYARRQAENARYLHLENRVRSFFRCRRDRFRQRRDYAFFRCPGCRQTVRVPRGKGKLRVTCRRCGYTFEKKT